MPLHGFTNSFLGRGALVLAGALSLGACGAPRSPSSGTELFRGPSVDFDHGPLRISDDRRHLVHADGTPFFWLIITPGLWIGSGGLLGWICHLISAYTAYNYARDHPS